MAKSNPFLNYKRSSSIPHYHPMGIFLPITVRALLSESHLSPLWWPSEGGISVLPVGLSINHSPEGLWAVPARVLRLPFLYPSHLSDLLVSHLMWMMGGQVGQVTSWSQSPVDHRMTYPKPAGGEFQNCDWLQDGHLVFIPLGTSGLAWPQHFKPRTSASETRLILGNPLLGLCENACQ